jgi:diguanylate cyclase (GGDEF)-like protein
VAQSPAITLPGVDIGEVLGRGTDTVVYRAVRHGRPYALKVLQAAAGEAGPASFRREAALLASLEHPGLVRVHEVGVVAGRPFLIMDLADGRSLEEVLRVEGPLAPAEAVSIVTEVASALAVAHGAGLVHRDVKPDNIVISPAGQARVVDFGLAVRAGHDAGAGTAGTFRYCAPEQTGMLHRPVDGRADLYALGVVLFECVSGRRPFTSEDAGELLREHLLMAPPDLRQLRPEVTPELAGLVAKLLAKDPDDRYQTAEELLAGLSRVDGGRPDAVPPAASRAGRPARDVLAGRDAELATLAGCWRQALAGQGATVVLEGAPGAGKTRLADELSRLVRSDGRPDLVGKCSADEGVPFAPIRAAIDGYLGRLPADASERSEAVVRAAAGPAAALLTSVSPTLAAILGTGALTAGLASHHDESRFAEAVVSFLVALGRAEDGLVLRLDDVQWADEATYRMLRLLAARADTAPLLLVVTVRNDLGGTGAALVESLGDAPALRLRVDPLPASAVAELVRGQLGALRVPDTLTAVLAGRCGGNPLAVREYVRAVLDAGLLLPFWGTWRLDEAGLDALALPDDVMSLVLRRVDQLGDSHRRLLTVAAAIGPRFRADLVAAAGAADRHATVAALHAAVAGQLLDSTDTAEYVFVHDRIREALLATLDPAESRAVHQRIADELYRAGGRDADSVYAVARHSLLGEADRRPAEVYHRAAEAGARALAEYAADEALAFLAAAAATAQMAGVRPDATFHTTYGLAATRVGQYALAESQLSLALDVETDPARRARLCGMLANTFHPRWQGQRAAAMIRQGFTELGAALPRGRVALLLSTAALLIGSVLLDLLPRRVRLVSGARRERYRLLAGLVDVGMRSIGISVDRPLLIALPLRGNYLAKRLGDGPEYAAIRSGVAGVLMYLGARRRSERVMSEVAAGVARSNDPGLIASIASLHALVGEMLGPCTATTGERTRHVLHTQGRWMSAGDYLHAIAELGYMLLTRGYLAEADEWHQRALARRSEVVGTATLGAQVAALAGRPAEAARYLRMARDEAARTPGNLNQAVNVAIAAVFLAVEQGETGTSLDRAMAEFPALGVGYRDIWTVHRQHWAVRAFGRLAQLAEAPPQRRAERAAAALAAVRELGRVANGPVLRAFHQATRASLEQLTGRDGPALRRLARLETASAGLDLPLLAYEVARVRARAHQTLGHRQETRQHAGVATALARTYGWSARERWIRAEFGEATAAGLSPSRPAHLPYATPGVPHHERRLDALQQVSLAAATAGNPTRLAHVALDEIVSIFGAERAFLFLRDDPDGALMPYLGRDSGGHDVDALTGYGSTLVQRVATTGDALVVTGAEEGAALGSQSTLVHGLRSIMVAPMRLADRVVGVVYLDSRIAKGIFTLDDVDLLAAITNQVALSMEMARAGELEGAVLAARRERDLADALRAAMVELSASLEPDDVAARLVAIVKQVLPVDTATLLYRHGGALVPVGGTEPIDDLGRPDGSAGPADPALEALIAGGRPQRGRRDAADPPMPRHFPAHVAAWLAVPLVMRGQQRGILLAGTTAERAYTDAELQIAAALAGEGLAAVDNALLFQRVRHLADRDTLTGLLNRRHFAEIGENHVARTGHPAMAIMIDIDHFKRVNDTYGHAVGDEVIHETAARLDAALRDTDLICRYGGDEFAILLPDTPTDVARHVAERLVATVTDTPIPTSAGPLPMTVTGGLAGPAEPGGRLWTLLNTADTALYHAKRGGRNRIEHHSQHHRPRGLGG